MVARRSVRRKPRRRNPTDYTPLILAGVGYMLYAKGALNGLLSPPVSGGSGGSGGGGASGMTYDQACATARSALNGLGWGQPGATCDQVKAKVCGDRTLFATPTGQDAEVRRALGCPL